MGCASSSNAAAAAVVPPEGSPTAKAPSDVLPTPLTPNGKAGSGLTITSPDDIKMKDNKDKDKDSETSPQRLGRLTPGGRQASMTMREAPALPLSPSSALRHNSLGTAANAKPHKGWSPLHSAAERGDLEGVQTAIEAQKVKIDTRTSDGLGCTALWLASDSGRLPVVKYLLEKGAAVDHYCSTGATPLYAASSRGQVDVIAALIEAGAALEKAAKNGTTALWAAVAAGHAATTELLLDNMALLTVKSKEGRGLLCAAAHSGQEEVMDLLLVFKSKLDLEARDETGHTPLYIAAQNGSVGAVRKLLQKGAARDAAMGDGTTPLWAAAYWGQDRCVKLLLDKGASLVVVTRRGELGEDFADGVSDDSKAAVQRHLQRAKVERGR